MMGECSINIKISDDVHRLLKIKCASQGISMKSYLSKIVSDSLLDKNKVFVKKFKGGK